MECEINYEKIKFQNNNNNNNKLVKLMKNKLI